MAPLMMEVGGEAYTWQDRRASSVLLSHGSAVLLLGRRHQYCFRSVSAITVIVIAAHSDRS